MKQQKIEEYLKERLLINNKGVVDSTFDELIEVVKILVYQKCIEQKVLCATNYLNASLLNNDNLVTNIILDTLIPTL